MLIGTHTFPPAASTSAFFFKNEDTSSAIKGEFVFEQDSFNYKY
jgi:hypothetical protein